jgi:hypothetical protein
MLFLCCVLCYAKVVNSIATMNLHDIVAKVERGIYNINDGESWRHVTVESWQRKHVDGRLQGGGAI